MTEIDIVKLSVQGQLFALPRESVLKHDWMVATLVTTNIPTDKIGDAFYIDCDGPSFRCLFSLLTGTMNICHLDSLHQIERCLLLSTAQFLAPSHELTLKIEQEMSKSVSFEKELKSIRESAISKQIEFAALKERMNFLEASSEEMRGNHGRIERIDANENAVFALYKCNAHRKYRPGNVCGLTTLQLSSGPISAPNCQHCETEMNFEKLGRHQTSLAIYMDKFWQEM